MPTNTTANGGKSILSSFPLLSLSKKTKQRNKRQSSRSTRGVEHFTLALAPIERSQLHGNRIAVVERRPKKKIGAVDYASIPPVPFPSTNATCSTIKEENVTWYQGYHGGYKRFYYYNDQTKESQWGRPANQPYIPYDAPRAARTTAGRVVLERSNTYVASSRTDKRPATLPHSSKCMPMHRPQTMRPTKNSEGSTQHEKRQEKMTGLVKSLVQATGRDSKQAKAALRSSNGNLDKAAKMLLKRRMPKTEKPARKWSKPRLRLHDEFMCSICLDVMMNPVVAADGHTYCKGCIRAWLKKKNTSPKTNQPLRHKVLTPNYALRSIIGSSVQA